MAWPALLSLVEHLTQGCSSVNTGVKMERKDEKMEKEEDEEEVKEEEKEVKEEEEEEEEEGGRNSL